MTISVTCGQLKNCIPCVQKQARTKMQV